MAITIDRQFFQSRDQVLDDLKLTGHWPSTLISDPAPEKPLHWHDLDVSGYIISGSLYLLDEYGVRHDLTTGDKFSIPRGTLHAEGEVSETVTYIIGMEYTGKIFEQFKQLDPDDPQRPLNPASGGGS